MGGVVNAFIVVAVVLIDIIAIRMFLVIVDSEVVVVTFALHH